MNRILGALALAVAVGLPPAVLSAHAMGPDAGSIVVAAGQYPSDTGTPPDASPRGRLDLMPPPPYLL